MKSINLSVVVLCILHENVSVHSITKSIKYDVQSKMKKSKDFINWIRAEDGNHLSLKLYGKLLKRRSAHF